MYSKKVMEHFLKPRNMGKIENADGIGKVGNVICGDVLWIYIKVKKDEKTGVERLSEISFQTFGCTVAIANSSMITEMAKGKTLEEAMKIGKDNILNELGEVPVIKKHCSILAADALHEAIYDYLTKNNRKISDEIKKRHGQIERERNTIEERYEHWTGVQEKTLEGEK